MARFEMAPRSCKSAAVEGSRNGHFVDCGVVFETGWNWNGLEVEFLYCTETEAKLWTCSPVIVERLASEG